MSFVKRFKQDKGYRLKTILIFIVIVLIAGNTGNKNVKKTFKTQEECNVYNNELFNPLCLNKCCWDYIGLNQCNELGEADVCEANGCWEGVEIIDLDEYGCFSCVPAGLYTRVGSDACCSGLADPMTNPDVSGYNYLCKAGTGTPQVCTDLQSQVGSIIKSIPGLGVLGCKTRFYIIAFGGGLLAFILMMSSL